ncbi:MAG: TonB-dependent receptor [Gammaproteobacteria bacterium]
MKKKHLCLLITSLFSIPLSGQVFAQEVTTSPDGTNQVIVTGIRASLRSALASKELSNNIVEVVAAEDIGKLPDTTIAESLARLPGLSAGMDRGNASQIVARGMGPRFVGATLNGRELASSEPNRAVRFEQFPSESLSGAIVYKSQNAEIVEGGVATSIDLQTVQPLKFKERQASVQADVLHYAIGSQVSRGKATKPRIGGIWLDQFANRTLGVALAFSHQEQPSINLGRNAGDFNENNSVDLTGDGKVDRTPWGLKDTVTYGTNARSSVLGKVEYKPNKDLLVTGDLYWSQAKINEPGAERWMGTGPGNWNGAQSADFSNVDSRNGYVVGASLRNAVVVSNDTLWKQDMDNLAGGLNAKLNVGDWKLEADLSSSQAGRDSAWRDVRLYQRTPSTLTWSITSPDHMFYDYGFDTAKAANYYASTPTLYVNTDGHIEDKLNGIHLNASRALDSALFERVKFGLRHTARDKSYHQTTWELNPSSAIPDSAYETLYVDGRPAYPVLKDFNATVAAVYGPNAFDPNGRTPTTDDRKAGWRVKEKSSSFYVQGDLQSEMFGKPLRGNVGVRVVRTEQSGEGLTATSGGWYQDTDGTWKERVELNPSVEGLTYTEVLPSLNLILNVAHDQQLRFSMARAMARAPIDEMRGARNVSRPDTPDAPLTGNGGNPLLKPMMSNGVDLSYQWYFAKGGLLSAGAFYKKVSRYITIVANETTLASDDPQLDGRNIVITQSVNGKGGNVRGLEFVYQQAFAGMPGILNNMGVSADYAYTTSNVKEAIPAANPFPIEGLIKHNGNVTLWYSNNGLEARISANRHSAVPRTPGWTAGNIIVNDAETWVSASTSYQITPKLQLRLAAENLTDQEVVFTSANNPASVEVHKVGRRYHAGLTYKF